VPRPPSTELALTWAPAAAAGSLALAASLASDTSWLKPQAERSPFSWLAAAAVVAAAAGVLRLARDRCAARRLLLAALLAALAADEAFGLHERFAADLDARRVALTWPAAGLAADALLLLVAGVLLVAEARGLRSATVAAGVALLAGALAMRFGGGVLAGLHRLPAGDARRTGEAVAQGIALAGWMLVAGGLLARAPARARTQAATQPRVR
jgi:hypothetical protein